ncbi:hypothetical protein A0H81_14193 [Grifola frondosa]|uniref:Uncharacterized protein n=1 Tax=Grifola frondosa TaxID=5627 RepID=A0A1C7LMB7_GRIFR|nr:hypothetical protein A0H81_14193 [Grifola frondosa]
MPVTNPTDNDRAQCWELVSNRVGDFDIVTVDDDVLKRLLPYFRPDDAAEFGHRIVKRAPGREKKGRSKDAHKPQNPRLLQDVTPTVLSIFQHVIDEWEDDRIQSNAQAGTRVSTTRTEVQQRWGIQIPSALRPGSDRPGWIRIDIQGTYEATPGQRVANIQGQWGNDSVFHVIVPVGVTIGRAVIRAAMHESLRTHTSVIIAASNSRPSSGGSKPGTTPPPPPGPSGGKGNGWIYFAAALIPIVLLSPLGM